MKVMIEKLIEMVGIVLPFLKKKDTKKIREFSELITGQYEFLVSQLEKMLKDYFGLSDRVKDMHAEILALRKELQDSRAQRCSSPDCRERIF